MEDNNKIGFAEALSVILILVLSHLTLLLPKIIIQSQGSATLINIVYITLLALFAIFILNKLYKNFKGMDILDISGYLFGKTFKFIVGVSLIVCFLFIASLLIRITAENLKTMYFQNTPTPYIVFFILFAVAMINRYTLKTIIKTNLIVTPLIAISFIVLLILSSSDFVFERLFPILGYGFENTFIKGSMNLFCFGNLVFLFFLMPHLKDYNQFNKLSYTSVIITGLLLLLVIGSILLMFPISIASGSSIPLYLQTRAITIGKFIQRIDALFVLIWNLSVLSYSSIIIGFINYIFKKITNVQNSSTVSYTFVAILFGTCLLYNNILQTRKLEAEGYKYIALSLTFIVSFIILILANIKKKFIKKDNIKGD